MSDIYRGMMLYTVSVCWAVLGDSFIKSWPMYKIDFMSGLFLRSFIMIITMGFIFRFRNYNLKVTDIRLMTLQFMRASSLALGSVCFLYGLQWVSFAKAYVYLQLLPGLTILMSVISFKEPHLKWLYPCLLTSLFGALIMIIPNMESWKVNSIDGLLLVGVGFYTVFFSTQRLIMHGISLYNQLLINSVVQCLLVAPWLGLEGCFNFGLGQWWVIGASAICQIFFLVFFVLAFRQTSSPVLMPFEHLGVPLAFLISYLWFGEEAKWTTWVGGWMIVGSSLTYMWRAQASKITLIQASYD